MFLKCKQNPWKVPMKKFIIVLFFKDSAEIEKFFFLYVWNSGTAICKEQPFFLNKYSNALEIKN